MTDTNRRTFVKIAAAGAVAPAVAGCTGGGNGNGNGNGDSGNGNGDGSGNGNGGGGGGNVPSEIDDYLSGAQGYDGSIADHTGESEVTVDVGTGGNGFGFDPAAIRIDAGTTVVWEWTGNGGAHNVVDEDGAFESDLMSEASETFEYTFEEAGNYRYYCNPHQANGMKGGVVVE
jgi:serine/threonine-protein kinase